MRPFLAAAILSATALAQSPLHGFWSEPTGSTIQAYSCGSDLCLRLTSISPQAPVTTDTKNPDASLRSHPLCGLVIGKGFHLTGNTAEGGELYDPKSGKTYKGTISREGDKLQLRGYIGIKLFGRTETWTKAPADFKPCT